MKRFNKIYAGITPRTPIAKQADEAGAVLDRMFCYANSEQKANLIATQ